MTLFDVIKITDGVLINGELSFKRLGKLCIDSRLIEDGDIFVTLSGNNTDGSLFIDDVLDYVSLIITDRDVCVNSSVPIIRVSDTRLAIKLIGEFIRTKFIDKPLIAVTGSVGKTTTKELISHVLSKKYNVLKTRGNYNNDLGVPIMLSCISDEHDVIVLELGMNHMHEIEELSRLCRPNIAVITNIGTSHIGYLKSKKNIFKAKMEIVKYLNDGVLVVNGDDSFLNRIKSNKYRVIKTHMNKDNLDFIINGHKVDFYVKNRGLMPNLLITYEVCKLFFMGDRAIVSSLNSFKPLDKRNNIIKLGSGITLIDDCYNASYESIICGVNYLNSFKGKKLLVLGDILELGKFSLKIHKKLYKFLKGFNDIFVVTVGSNVKVMDFLNFSNNDDLISYFSKNDFSNISILIKGSRGMHLEEIKNYFTKRYSL